MAIQTYGSDTAIYQGRRRSRSSETGTVLEKEWKGTASKIAAKFDSEAAAMAVGGGARSLESEEINGRGRLIARYAAEPEVGGGFDQASDVVEELYAIDIVTDIRQHPSFAAGQRLAISAQELLEVKNGLERPSHGWSATWTNAQKTLYNMISRGMDSYLECSFVLRQSIFAARSRQVRQAFQDVGRVPQDANGNQLPPPTLSAAMRNLITALPDGEWLARPATAEYLGRGKWRLSREYQWSRAWSWIYGGTQDFGILNV